MFALLCLASYAWFHRNGPLKGLRGGTQFVPHLPSGGCTSAHVVFALRTLVREVSSDKDGDGSNACETHDWRIDIYREGGTSPLPGVVAWGRLEAVR